MRGGLWLSTYQPKPSAPASDPISSQSYVSPGRLDRRPDAPGGVGAVAGVDQYAARVVRDHRHPALDGGRVLVVRVPPHPAGQMPQFPGQLPHPLGTPSVRDRSVATTVSENSLAHWAACS